jgi:16S rRNA (cytosine1402-N4)-methyltransferase
MEHISVLKNEAIKYLNIKDDGIYYDATYGGGGHTKEILNRNIAALYATDKDSNVTPITNEKLNFVRSDFVEFLKEKKYEHILFDGILADFGVSNMQILGEDRGFSFLHDYYLDMRMDQTQELDAHYVVNNYSSEELFIIIKKYGEEKFASKIANSIVRNRPINTTFQLVDAVKQVKKSNKKNINPATQTFQAIRIEVNQELKKIEEFLDLAVNRLKKNGRLVVISFHSLEDRIVKWHFLEYKKDCICPTSLPVCSCDKISLGNIITKKPIIPLDEEIKINPKSRSAKLRAFERV